MKLNYKNAQISSYFWVAKHSFKIGSIVKPFIFVSKATFFIGILNERGIGDHHGSSKFSMLIASKPSFRSLIDLANGPETAIICPPICLSGVV